MLSNAKRRRSIKHFNEVLVTGTREANQRKPDRSAVGSVRGLDCPFGSLCMCAEVLRKRSS